MINSIFFDVGGTLIHPDLGALLAPLLARVQPSAEQLAAADRAAKYLGRHNGDDSPALRTNTGHWQVYLDTLVRSLGCCQELLPELSARAANSSYWTMVDPAAASILLQLKSDYRLAVISNADGRIRDVLTRAGLAEFFDQITDSRLVGCEKPHPRIFQSALQGMNARPEEALYVGDIYDIDYRGATGAGMRAVLLDPDGIYRDWRVPRLSSLQELPGWLAVQQ